MSALKQAIEDLLANSGRSVQEAVSRHFTPDFRQRTNGNWDDRDTFVARIAGLRDLVAKASVTVLDELVDGERYAHRHIIDLVTRDGGRIVQEVYLFARRAPDGRFAFIEETTRALQGAAE